MRYRSPLYCRIQNLIYKTVYRFIILNANNSNSLRIGSLMLRTVPTDRHFTRCLWETVGWYCESYICADFKREHCMFLYDTYNKLNYYKKCRKFRQTFSGVPGSVDTIATGYGVGGPGIESRWGRDFLHPSRTSLGPIQSPIQWIPGVSRG